MVERIVHDETNKFLSENSVLFRPNLSTNLCVGHLRDKISKGFDKVLLAGMILNDLQKAFNTINHKVLLQKLKAIRFSKQSIQCCSVVLPLRPNVFGTN